MGQVPYAEWACMGCGKNNSERPGVEDRYVLGLYVGRFHDDCFEAREESKEEK